MCLPIYGICAYLSGSRSYLVARVHSSHIGRGEDRLDGIILSRDRARDATVDAKDIVIDHARQRQTVEHLVALFPHLLAESLAEAGLRVVDVRKNRCMCVTE